jgi:hypothetical protein
MSSNNVVNFPKAYSGPKEKVTVENINRNIDMMKQFHIQETISNIAPMVFNQLEISGFSFLDDETEDDLNLKDGAFIIESLRSIMCKYYDIYHPFQKLSEEIFYPDPNEPGTLRIADRVEINLKDESESETES